MSRFIRKQLGNAPNAPKFGPFRQNRHCKTLAIAIVTVLTLVSFTVQASAQWTRTRILQPTTPQAESHFGAEVAIGPIDLIVSAPDLDLLQTDQGAAQAYYPYNGKFYKDYVVWSLYGDTGERLGHAMDYDVGALIVGAPGASNSKGAAFLRISKKDTMWLTAASDDRDTNDLFGCSVSMDDSIAAVGACFDDEGGMDAGAIYIWEPPYSSYTKIVGAGSGHHFGDAVAVDNDRIAASSPGASPAFGGGYGQIRVLESSGSGWATIATLDNPNSGVFGFGTSIAMDGDVIAVGTESAGSNGGRVFIYDLSVNRIDPVAELVSPDGANGDLFGIDVDVDGDRILVGAPLFDAQGPRRTYKDCGAAYFFVRSGNDWVLEQRILARSIKRRAEFGRSVAVYGCMAVVGAPYTGSDDAGKAYVYECN